MKTILRLMGEVRPFQSLAKLLQQVPLYYSLIVKAEDLKFGRTPG